MLLTGQQHADVRNKCDLIKKLCNRKFLQRQVNTAIRKRSNWGDFLKRLEQMYPVYETDLSVGTEIEALPSLPEFPTAPRISDFVAHLEELMGRMNPGPMGLLSLICGFWGRFLRGYGGTAERSQRGNLGRTLMMTGSIC